MRVKIKQSEDVEQLDVTPLAAVCGLAFSVLGVVHFFSALLFIFEAYTLQLQADLFFSAGISTLIQFGIAFFWAGMAFYTFRMSVWAARIVQLVFVINLVGFYFFNVFLGLIELAVLFLASILLFFELSDFYRPRIDKDRFEMMDEIRNR